MLSNAVPLSPLYLPDLHSPEFGGQLCCPLPTFKVHLPVHETLSKLGSLHHTYIATLGKRDR
jgi:hypothetical protein